MTVNTTTINGFIVLPDDTVREKSSVIFTMTGFDTDADDNATVVPIPRDAPIASDGSIDIDLWPNPEGVRTTFYRVTFSIYNGNKPYLVDGGLIDVPVSGGPYDLNDLLPIAPPQGATVEEYIAQLAASVAAAESAADRAEDAADGVLGPFASRSEFEAWVAAGNTADDGVIASDGTVQYVAKFGATAISDILGWLPFLIDQRADLRHWGVAGTGLVDDKSKVDEAIASGYNLTGKGLLVGVSGKVALPADIDMQDVLFRQLDPGASLSVITLEASGVNNVTLRRVAVDRNGDGTNGGLLDGAGVNGALNTSFAVNISGGSGHWLEDLEVYGDDSGTGIRIFGLDSTSTIIRPYAHDMNWSRTTASDDMVQGVFINQCEGTHVESPYVRDMAGTENGVPTRRFTRGMALSGNRGVGVHLPIVKTVDQGIDWSGDEGNYDCVTSNGYVEGAFTWGYKFANSARRCVVEECIAWGCGVGYVASGNASLAADERTNRTKFVNCHSINAGATGQAVVTSAGFRILGSTDAAAATDCMFYRCSAVDLQGSATMTYGFMSETTDTPDVMPFAKDCYVEGAVTGDFQGNWRRPRTGSTAQGDFEIRDDGAMECWIRDDITSTDITAASGSLFVSTGSYNWTFPEEFSEIDVMVGSFERGTSLASGVHIDNFSTTQANVFPWASVSISTGNTKFINLRAVGRAW